MTWSWDSFIVGVPAGMLLVAAFIAWGVWRQYREEERRLEVLESAAIRRKRNPYCTHWHRASRR